MYSERNDVLARTLVNYSIDAKKGDVISIDGPVVAKPLVLAIMKVCNEQGLIPVVKWTDEDVTRLNYLGMSDERIAQAQKDYEYYIDSADRFIRIRSFNNDFYSVDVDSKVIMGYQKALRPLSKKLLAKPWVLLNYPSPTQAMKAKMSTEAFYDFAMNVMTVDYQKMDDAMQPLKALMLKTDKVRIVAPNTDLTFSINGLPVIECSGQNNIPDGEVFTAPVKDSVNGTITYNTASPYAGSVFENVSLTFKDGKIIDATCENGDLEKLEEIFNTDEGARYVGEFAIGVNPMITKPMGDILFDEKIAGSIHFTPGMAYDDCNNGNNSAVHWDLVLIQTPEYGGGEIYFDDVLIRKDGLFVIDELKGLNPENLK